MPDKRQPSFVCLRRTLLNHPPIRHRHTHYRAHHLSPFQFAIALALTASARRAVADAHHQKALKAGAKAITSEKQTGKIVKRRYRREMESQPTFETKQDRKAWERYSKLIGVKKTDKRSALRHAGQKGYARCRAKLRKSPLTAFVTLELSRYAVLRLANLDTSSMSMWNLTAALNRLSRFVAIKGIYEPPLIKEWQELPSGKLRLVVSTDWTQPPFGKVPLPLPTLRSPTAVALHLLLFTLNTSATNQEGMALDPLCERLGILTEWSVGLKVRSIARALELVNEHLATLEPQGIKVPVGFRIDDSDDRIRFERIERQLRDDDDEDEIMETGWEVDVDDDMPRNPDGSLVRVRLKRFAGERE